MKKYRITHKINQIVVYCFCILISAGVIYPLIYVVSAAFSPGTGIASVSILPFGNGFTFKHFIRLFSDTNYVIWFRNTLIIATGTSVLTVLIASIGAYVFSRFRFRAKKPMMMSLLIFQIFPSFVGMVAIYVILLRINGFNELWGLVLVYVAGNIPYNVWLVKGYIDTVPKSIDEAARIDGAGYFRIYATIIMPIIRPIITFLAITSFVMPWMDFIFPKMVLRSSDKQTLALGLFNFVTDKKNEFTTFAAGALLVAIPFIIFFVFAQKTMITSFGRAAVKE